MTNKRARLWTFVVYPESMPDNWLDILEQLYVATVISPLHDKDIDLNDELKKPHYHVLLLYEGNKSYRQIKEITDSLNAPIPQVVGSAKGLVRYMLHIDNPDKYQYNAQDMKSLNGADISELLKPSSGDRYTMIKDMLQYINDNMILEFEDLLYYAMDHKFDTWFPLLCDNSSYIIGKAIDSKRYRYRKYGSYRKGDSLIDKETGEIVDTFY